MITISTYIHFTKEQREQARRTDLAQFLISLGEKVRKAGSEYEWLDGSQKVTIRGHLWYHQYEQKGGDAIDFVRRFYNKDYAEAVEMLLNGNGGQIITSPPIEKEYKPFELPPRNDRMSRVFSYLLLTRGIDKDVLFEFVRKKMIYESAYYHNAVFVGYDSSGKPRHVHKRGTVTSNPYKGNVAGSQPEYSFHFNGTSDKIFLFEAPIDMLSYISMQKAKDLQEVSMREDELKYNKTFERELAAAACRWKNHSYAASCSVSDRVLFQCLKDNPNIKNVCLCFDNDEVGQKANKRIADKLNKMNIQNEILIPNHKDWNEDLTFSEKGDERICHQIVTLIIVIGSMFAMFIIISTVGNHYSLNRIKNKTVGQGQHGTARWATKKEIKRTYKQIDFQPNEWRNNPESRPTEQGIVVGCKNGRKGTTALVDTGDVHALMIGAAGVGKTTYWLYPCIEYACATGMSFLSTDTKGDIVRNYGTIAEKYYEYKISVIDLRNPT